MTFVFILSFNSDQLTYPKTGDSDHSLTDEKLKELLELVDLSYLIENKHEEVSLSMGDYYSLTRFRSQTGSQS